MCDNNNSVNDRILTGQGLSPIADGSSDISGIVTESKGADMSGTRFDSLNNIQENNNIVSGLRLDLFSRDYTNKNDK